MQDLNVISINFSRLSFTGVSRKIVFTMGRVFTYEAITAGHVPQVDDFQGASELFREELRLGYANGTIDGGFIFGSVSRGTPTIRSDFDAFIALKDANERAYRAAHAIGQSIRQEYGEKILFEPIAYPKQTLASGNHELNQMFGSHLVGGYRVIVGNDPAEYITFPQQPVRNIVSEYVFQKARKLTNSYMKSELQAINDNGLQRMLELPNSIGRKVLQGLHTVGYPEYNGDASDKLTVFEQSELLFAHNGLSEGFYELVSANDDYTDLLQATVDGMVSQKAYDNRVAELKAKMPLSIEWLRQVGKTFLPLLQEADDTN